VSAAPQPSSLADLGVAGTVDAIRGGTTTAAARIDAALARIAETDGVLGAWVTVDEDGARAQARALDRARAGGRPTGPLHGVPVGIKDLIDVAGLPTTNGAPAFAHSHPAADATLVARLRGAGVVIVGKTVPTMFAYKDPAPTLNPWAADRTPGGSSTGSAVAVAARQVPVAIGTQTIGSILRPSAFCGVVGLKGDHGAVPADGVFPLSWTLDHLGPIGRSVADVALVEAVLLGRPVAPEPVDAPRLGVSPALFEPAEPALRAHLEGLVRRFADDGAEVVEVELPAGFEALLDAGRLILEAEAATVHEAWFKDHAAAYGPQVAGLVEAGLGRTATQLVRASRVRDAYRDAVAPVLAACDAVLSPVAPGPAPLRAVGTGDVRLCAPWSFTGVPAISIPTGLDGDGLPLALQLVGGPGRLGRLLGAAAWCERVIGFDERPAAPSAVGAGSTPAS